MQINQDDLMKLIEQVETMKKKLDLYEKLENAREKEFRELERDVHRLWTRLEPPSLLDQQVREGTIPTASAARRHSDSISVGQSWLR